MFSPCVYMGMVYTYVCVCACIAMCMKKAVEDIQIYYSLPYFLAAVALMEVGIPGMLTNQTDSIPQTLSISTFSQH